MLTGLTGLRPLDKKWASRKLAFPLRWRRSESRRFVAFEVRVVAAEQEGFQTLCIPNDFLRNSFAFDREVISESVDCAHHRSMD